MFKTLQVIFLVFLFWGLPVYAGETSSVVAWFDQETSEQIEELLQSDVSLSAPLIGVSRLFSHEEILNLY